MTLILDREDINNPLHPNLFNDWCEALGLNPAVTNSIHITVSRAEAF